MSKIDFYTQVADPQAFACRLSATVMRKKERLLIWLDHESALETFSNRLWSFDDTRFVPNCRLGAKEAAQTPIWLTTQLPETLKHPVLLNLGEQMPQVSQFERILEIVGRDEAALATARQRFKYYRAQGCIIEHHDMSAKP